MQEKTKNFQNWPQAHFQLVKNNILDISFQIHVS